MTEEGLPQRLSDISIVWIERQQAQDPNLHASVMCVSRVPEGDQRVHVEEIRQGKSASRARICSEVTCTSGGEIMTGSPVTGLVAMR